MMGFGFCFAKVRFFKICVFEESIVPLSNVLSDPTMLQKIMAISPAPWDVSQNACHNWDKFANLILLSPDFSVNQENHQNISTPNIQAHNPNIQAYPIPLNSQNISNTQTSISLEE